MRRFSASRKKTRLLMLKMMQGIGNKLEAKMDNLQETLTKEIQDIKLKQEEMQDTITEIKKSTRSSYRQNTGGRRTNKRGGGQMSGNYGCRTEKRKKIEK